MKHMTRRTALGSLLAAGASLGWPAAAWAQEPWPSKPIRMVHSSPAGSGPDVLARVFAEQLAVALKQPVVVDNRPGANGKIAVETVVRARPDGYTLLFASASATVLNQAVQPKLPFDVLTDLAPVSQIGSGGILMVTAPDFPARNLKEFIVEAKAHPGKYDYASWGVGSTGHLVMAHLQSLTGAKLNHVAYKSVPQILGDLQSGIVKVAMVDVTSSIPLVKSGKIRALAITGTEKLPAFADVPTMTEQGVPMDNNGWYGVFLPKGTPKEIVATFNREINQSLRSAALRERFTQLNMMENPPLTTPEQFARTMKTDYEMWARIAKTSNITLE